MRVALVIVALAACKSHHDPIGAGSNAGSGSGSGSGSIQKPGADWSTCQAALEHAPKAPANRRVQAILDGCQPCGEWDALARWNTTAAAGGPTRLAIENAMAACGYCGPNSDPNAKQRFLGALDDARGSVSRAPWRLLGEVCKAQTSAVPDGRFMSAPYYALDRIARAAGARPETKGLLAAIDLELPALSIVGVGVELPNAPVIDPKISTVQITVSPLEIRAGKLPHATMTPDGLVVDHGGDPYPGTLVAPKDLDAALTKLVPEPPKAAGSATPVARTAVAIFAPRGMIASALVPAIAAAGHHLLVLAVAAHGAPVGWQLPGIIPIPLDVAPDPKAPVLTIGASADAGIVALKAAPNVAHYTIAIAPDATVESFATLLGAIAYRSPERVSVVLSKPSKP